MEHKQRLAIDMKKALLTVWVGLYVGCDRVSGDVQGGANSVNQTDGISEMASACQLCGSVGGEFRKWTMAFLCGGKLSASSCLDARPFTSSLYASVLFKLLPLCWSSDGVSLSR